MEYTLLSKPFANILLDPNVPAIYEQWTGTTTPSEFREILEEKLAFYKREKTTYNNLQWIADIRGLRGLDEKVEEWAISIYHPAIYAAGVERVAFVVPETVYAQLPDDKLNGKYDNSNEVFLCYFDSLEEAKAWASQEHEVLIGK